MLNSKKLYTKILSMLKSFIYVQEMSKSFTVAANAAVAVDFAPSKSGYTFVGVAGFSTGHGSVLLQQVRKIDASTVRMSVRNITGSSISSTAYAYIIFVRTGGGATS